MRFEGTVGVGCVDEGRGENIPDRSSSEHKARESVGREQTIVCVEWEASSASTKRLGPIEEGFENVWVGRSQTIKHYLVMLASHKGKGKPPKKFEKFC